MDPFKEIKLGTVIDSFILSGQYVQFLAHRQRNKYNYKYNSAD